MDKILSQLISVHTLNVHIRIVKTSAPRSPNVIFTWGFPAKIVLPFPLSISCTISPFSDCPNNKKLLQKSVNRLVKCTIKCIVMFYYLLSLQIVLHEIFAGHCTTLSSVAQFRKFRGINLQCHQIVDQYLFD